MLYSCTLPEHVCSWRADLAEDVERSVSSISWEAVLAQAAPAVLLRCQLTVSFGLQHHEQRLS